MNRRFLPISMEVFFFRMFNPIETETGWPQTWKTWKTWKTQGIWKIVKISGKTQGNLNFCRKNLENSGKMKNMWHDRQQKYPHRIFLSWVAQGKSLKYPGKLRENSGKTQGKLRESSCSKMWSPCERNAGKTYALIIKSISCPWNYPCDSSSILQRKTLSCSSRSSFFLVDY